MVFDGFNLMFAEISTAHSLPRRGSAIFSTPLSVGLALIVSCYLHQPEKIELLMIQLLVVCFLLVLISLEMIVAVTTEMRSNGKCLNWIMLDQV